MSTAGRDLREAWRGHRPGAPRPSGDPARPGPEAAGGEPEPPRPPTLDRTTYLARSHRLDGHVGT